ncbi:hypothetical protein ACP275_13G038400 [Erythranthe tilingii]
MHSHLKNCPIFTVLTAGDFSVLHQPPRFLTTTFKAKIKTMDYFNINFDDGFCTENYSSKLVLDNERGELVRAAVVKSSRAKVGNADKALVALRNHSQAERRRRERINAHLATLRTLIPGTVKLDKAALLGEVVNRVKELRRSMVEATNGALVPTEVDEVIVEQHKDENPNNCKTSSVSIRASLCCDFTHELLSDLRQALDETLPLNANITRAEIATMGSRMVNVFLISGQNESANNAEGIGDQESQLLITSVRQALQSVLDKYYASEEFSSRNTMPPKRRRVSLIDSSSSSSLGDMW